MLSWSYMAAVLTEPGSVPAGWTPFATVEVGAGFAWAHLTNMRRQGMRLSCKELFHTGGRA